MLRQHECGARSGPVLRHQPARLVPHPTRITKRLRAHGPGPPLRRLICCAMQAFSPVTGTTVVVLFLPCCRRFDGFLSWVCRRWNDDVRFRRRRGWREDEKARGPVAWRPTRPLAAGLGRNRHFGVEYRVVSVGFGLDFTGFGCFVDSGFDARYQL